MIHGMVLVLIKVQITHFYSQWHIKLNSTLKVAIIKDKQLIILIVMGQHLEEGMIYKWILTLRVDIVILVTLTPLVHKLKVNLIHRVNYLEVIHLQLKMLKYLV